MMMDMIYIMLLLISIIIWIKKSSNCNLCQKQNKDIYVHNKRRNKMIVTGMKEFESICLNKLVEWYNINGGELIDLSNVFIVWSCKTLQN